jgi:hypothetical protein
MDLMDKTSNVIQFPFSGQQKTKTISVEETEKGVNMVKYNHINSTLSTVVPMLFNNIELAGFHVVPEYGDSDDKHLKDGSLIVESIRSILCKYYDLKHPFQILANNVFITIGDDHLKLADRLEMDIEPEDVDEYEELEDFEEDSES